MSPPANYGAVENQTDHEFDGRYLEEPTLSREERMKKLFLTAVPILAAVLIVGGAALFLLRDFDNLYPGHHGGGREPSIRINPRSHMTSTESSQPTEETTSGSPVVEESDGSNISSLCSAHESCSKLSGLCCPTADGIFLVCCN